MHDGSECLSVCVWQHVVQSKKKAKATPCSCLCVFHHFALYASEGGKSRNVYVQEKKDIVRSRQGNCGQMHTCKGFVLFLFSGSQSFARFPLYVCNSVSASPCLSSVISIAQVVFSSLSLSSTASFYRSKYVSLYMISLSLSFSVTLFLFFSIYLMRFT
jgi:hypothetical protein